VEVRIITFHIFIHFACIFLGKKYCYGGIEGEYCHCDYCKCKHGFGLSGYGGCGKGHK
jgi:hypothetical protein